MEIERQYKQPEERKREVLKILSLMSDGARPNDLAEELGISKIYAAVLLSQYKRQGILLKRKTSNGNFKYELTAKGDRKLAYLESIKHE